MNSHQVYQTACLLVLCILGVVLTTQLSSIEERYQAADNATNASLARSAELKLKGEARIKAGDRALGLEYLSTALTLNMADQALRSRIAELQAQTLLAQPSVLNTKNALTFHALFQQVMEQQGGKTPISVRIAFGKTLAYRGLLEEAKTALEEAIKLAPESANARLFRGDVHMQERQWQAAIDQFDKAAQLDGKNPLVHFGRGVALLELKKIEDAEEPLQTAAKALNSVEPYLKLGRVQALLRKWEDAEISFARAEAFKTNAAKLDPLYATVLSQRDKKPQAIQVAAVRARMTGDPISYLQMGNWYLDLEQYKNALPIFKQLRKLDTKESDYECKYALAHEKLKALDKAAHFYQKCKEKAEDVEGRKSVLEFANQRLATLTNKTGKK